MRNRFSKAVCVLALVFLAACAPAAPSSSVPVLRFERWQRQRRRLLSNSHKPCGHFGAHLYEFRVRPAADSVRPVRLRSHG